jgi:ankyrin repeat protein
VIASDEISFLYLLFANENSGKLNNKEFVTEMLSDVDMNGQTLMHHAAKNNSINIANIIKHVMRDIADEEKLKELFNAHDDYGLTPIFIAIENFNMEMFEFLLKNDLFEITQKETRNNEGIMDFLDRNCLMPFDGRCPDGLFNGILYLLGGGSSEDQEDDPSYQMMQSFKRHEARLVLNKIEKDNINGSKKFILSEVLRNIRFNFIFYSETIQFLNRIMLSKRTRLILMQMGFMSVFVILYFIAHFKHDISSSCRLAINVFAALGLASLVWLNIATKPLL